MKNLLIYLGLGLVFASCGLETKEYYFDLNDFKEGKVYVLACEESPEYTQYWEMKSDGDQLSTIVYESGMKKTSEMVEKYGDTGAELVSLKFYDPYFSEGVEEDCEVFQKEVMNWSVKDAAFHYSVRFSGVLGVEGEMQRARTYLTRAHIDVLGEKYEVLSFRDVVTYSESPEVFTSMKYYAKGLGIVAMDFEDNGEQKVLLLKEILTMEDWEALKATHE